MWHHAGMSEPVLVKVGPKGRVVIPEPLRRELGITEGAVLVARVDEGAVSLVPREAIANRLRAMFADVPHSLAEDLIRDRRQEAALEAKGS